MKNTNIRFKKIHFISKNSEELVPKLYNFEISFSKSIQVTFLNKISYIISYI